MQSAPAADAGGADSYATSFTLRSRHLVSGAEIQATIYDNITRQLFIAAGLAWLLAACTIAAALLAAAAVWRGTGWMTAVFAAARHRRFRSSAASCCCSSAGSTSRRSRRRVAFVAVAGGAKRARLRGRAAAAAQHHPRLLAISVACPGRAAGGRSERLRLGGERKTLSILFSDVRGFTTISEALKDEPERLTR